ncbi:MAG: glutamate--cysteine ligase [Gammaproteobacteria bacterium]|nr:glutamate--cysteine ligase [Gammaproteobacteria bacterium]
MSILPFSGSPGLSIGIELELQLVELASGRHAFASEDMLRDLDLGDSAAQIKPEISQSMIEINSSIHRDFPSLSKELQGLRELISGTARGLDIGVCGGGTHPFQPWADQRISDTSRYKSLAERYGFLAKQFAVFGQHIHLGVPDGDTALYLCHALTRYLPHFVALSASSPFYQGVDTGFACSRLSVVNAFPLSGMPPWVFRWEEFEHYFEQLRSLGVVRSMKDFYWDHRPKPEYGTVEIRIADTPLTVHRAALLAAYAQALAAALLEERPRLKAELYQTYAVNRFRAARYGLAAELLCPERGGPYGLQADILDTLSWLEPYGRQYAATEALEQLRALVHTFDTDDVWLRKSQASYQELPAVVRAQAGRWMSA